MARNTIKVAVLHRNRLFAESLAYDKMRPDIAIVDGTYVFPDEDRRAVAKVSRPLSGVKTLLLGKTDNESEFLAAIDAGADGYLTSSASLQMACNSVTAIGQVLIFLSNLRMVPGLGKLLVPPTCFWGGTRFEVPRFS